MSAPLKGTKTEKNLLEAFAGESQARNKYTCFASVAKKEGYERIAAFSLETAENEKEHAKLNLKALGGIGTTADNLREAAAGASFRRVQGASALEILTVIRWFVSSGEVLTGTIYSRPDLLHRTWCFP